MKKKINKTLINKILNNNFLNQNKISEYLGIKRQQFNKFLHNENCGGLTVLNCLELWKIFNIYCLEYLSKNKIVFTDIFTFTKKDLLKIISGATIIRKYNLISKSDDELKIQLKYYNNVINLKK